MTHRLAAAALACAVAASISACGGGGHAAGPASSRTVAGGDQDFVAFTRCVRAHGVAIADPSHRSGHAGLTLDFPSPTPAALAAERSCQHYIQPVIDAKNAGARALMVRIRLPLIRYAECMRTHGIPLKDPTPTGNLELGNVPGMNAGPGRDSQQFRTADRACRHLLPAGVTDNGTGP